MLKTEWRLIRANSLSKHSQLGVCSTVGSAPRSGRGGRKFESSHPDPSKGSAACNHKVAGGFALFIS